MVQTTNRFFDEVARLMNDAAGVAQGVRREFETLFRSQAERFLRDLDLVKREDFEAVRDMARIAREENEALKTRLAAAEAEIAAIKAKIDAKAEAERDAPSAGTAPNEPASPVGGGEAGFLPPPGEAAPFNANPDNPGFNAGPG